MSEELNSIGRMYKNMYEDEKRKRLRYKEKTNRKAKMFMQNTYELLKLLGMSDSDIFEYYQYKRNHSVVENLEM